MRRIALSLSIKANRLRYLQEFSSCGPGNSLRFSHWIFRSTELLPFFLLKVTTPLERGESRSDRRETADSRRELAQIGAAECPACAVAAAVLVVRLPAAGNAAALSVARPPAPRRAGRRPRRGRAFPPPWALLSPLPVRPFSTVFRRRGAHRPIISPRLGGAAPGSARQLPGRTRPRRLTFSADSRQLARSFSPLIPQGSRCYQVDNTPALAHPRVVLRAAKSICSAATWARHCACGTLTHHPVGGHECSSLLALRSVLRGFKSMCQCIAL